MTEVEYDKGWFGRLYVADDRDVAYPLQAAPLEETDRVWNYHAVGEVLNQGRTSQCVAYSIRKFLQAGPIYNENDLPDLYTFYKACQKIDQWPGEDYDGTSVRAGFSILKDMGYVEKYVWARNVHDMASHVLNVGPVVVGSNWYTGMNNTDEHGYIRPVGRPYGGHAWCVHGVNRERPNPDGSVGAFRMINSWGREWGEAGRAWISFDDMQLLLNQHGEAATAYEIIKK